MTCYYPLQGYRSKELTKNGKRKIVFSPKDGYVDLKMTVPCGQCIGCRLERSRQWAIRCVHEASLYEDNCFITLTYSNKFLPSDLSLKVKHFQDFMKRLRKRFGSGIRFFHCGEYGEQFGRPHYHAIIFNLDFPDKVLWQERNGEKLYRSQILEELWPFGHSSVGSATFESAAYVARYIMKKHTGKDADEHYKSVDLDSGEFIQRKPEYTTMSRRPGIGKDYFDTWNSDIYPSDEVILRNIVMKPPKYYDSLYEILYPDELARIKALRKIEASKHSENNTWERLAVRCFVKESKIKRLVRNFD